MNLSVTRWGLGIVCAVALNVGSMATSSQAGLIPWMYESIFGTSGYGYGAGYAPAVPYGYGGGYGYTAGYGGGFGGGCCLFGGCGLFGCHRPTYVGYAPSYYAPSYGNPGCSTCGTSAAYSLSGLGCCDSCSGLGCASGNCASGNCASGDCLSDGGSLATPYNGTPMPTPDTSRPSDMSTTPTQSNPAIMPERTYIEEDPNDPFVKPRTSPGTSGGSGFEPAGGAAGEPRSSSPGLIKPQTDAPANPPADPGSEIERGGGIQFNYKIPAKNHSEPPANDTNSDESQIVRPLKVTTQIVSHGLPQRSRSLYRAGFHTPSVTRADVPARSDWEPISETKLATAR